MGQHFLADPNVAATILHRAHFHTSDFVIEVGAGLGALTVPLALQTRHVLAIEPDRKIAELLKNELLAAGLYNVTIIEQDVLSCDIGGLAMASDRPLKVIGNLPYHISSQVLIHVINAREFVDRAILTFQKEVAERLIAQPGTRVYGRLSVLTQYCAHIDSIVQIPASAFYPRPKVDSEVVGVSFFRPPPFPAVDEQFLFRVIQAAFGKRRKTLKNALVNSPLGFGEDPILVALEKAGIDPGRRAETLEVKDFVRLANLLRE